MRGRTIYGTAWSFHTGSACSRRAGRARNSVRPQHAVGAMWNEGLCGRNHDGPRLMRKSLGGRHLKSEEARVPRPMVGEALGLLLLTACSSGPVQPGYHIHTLSSGEQVKVMSVTSMTFPQSGPALMLKYQTDLDIADTAALRTEAERIWADFRTEVERAGVQSAILSANSPASPGIVRHSRGYNFVYGKQSDGTWQRLGKPHSSN